MSWIQRTYAVGTPVKFVKGTPVPWSNEVIPAGARGVVVGHQFDLDADDYLHIARILVEIADARYRDGSVIDDLVGRVTTVDAIYFTVMSEDILAWLTPLQDNWAQASAPLTRHQLPRSQRRSSRRKLGYDPEPNPGYQSYRCPSCGGVSHPASGSVLPSGKVVCGPCVRRAWDWAAEHGKKSYRVGPKGKGAKYIPFPTGVLKKNTIPPPPIGRRSPQDVLSWVKRTYAPGTRIEFLSDRGGRWTDPELLSLHNTIRVPRGTRGTVIGIEKHRDVWWVKIRVIAAPYLYTREQELLAEDIRRVGDVVFVSLPDAADPHELRALDDNWAAAQQQAAAASRRRSSYKTRPNGKKRRSSKSPETQELIDKARDAGWRIEYTEGNHVRLYPPDSSKPAVGATLSRVDPRAWLNFRAALRRSGLDVNRRTSRRR
jgi:hypothetical protein